MISYNESDTNVMTICRNFESRGFTKYKYYIYGLHNSEVPVLIEHGSNLGDEDKIKLSSLSEFFKLNGIDVEFLAVNKRAQIDIGLRLDLRRIVNKHGNPTLASAIVSTIISTMEGSIDMKKLKTYEIPSKPKFSTDDYVRVSPTLDKQKF